MQEELLASSFFCIFYREIIKYKDFLEKGTYEKWKKEKSKMTVSFNID